MFSRKVYLLFLSISLVVNLSLIAFIKTPNFLRKRENSELQLSLESFSLKDHKTKAEKKSNSNTKPEKVNKKENIQKQKRKAKIRDTEKFRKTKNVKPKIRREIKNPTNYEKQLKTHNKLNSKEASHKTPKVETTTKNKLTKPSGEKNNLNSKGKSQNLKEDKQKTFKEVRENRIGLKTESGKPLRKSDYLKEVLREIERNKYYPLIARRMGIEGSVELLIVINDKGKLERVTVLKASSEILSKAAVKTLKKCSFPKPPGGKFKGKIKINYVLK